MKRVKAILCVVLLSVGMFAVSLPALADPPDILRSYEFLPRLSTLHQTGGIAGLYFEFPVFGTYDFVTGFRYETDPASIARYAKFENVEAYGAHPTMDPGLSLDWVMNLSGLDGNPIYHGPNGLELFQFAGTAGSEGAKTRVHLLAARLGRWMFLKGHTEPPCCDFFQYDLKGLARQIPSGDWDDDGRVNAADLALWQEASGASMTGRHFLIWQQQFGEEAPPLAEFEDLMNSALAAVGAVSVQSVPEPTAACLAAWGIFCCCSRLVRRRGA